MDKIRIYTNESVDVAIAEGLKRRGVDASSARDTGNLGLSDAPVGGSDQAGCAVIKAL